MGRLHQANIPVYLLHGNHDAESQITKRLELPDNVHVFGAQQAESFLIDELGVSLHGQSFSHRDVSDNLALQYPKPVENAFNIGVLHTGLGGMGGHANYAPCALDDLLNRGYQYWALGHVHAATVLNEYPHVVFPGNLQGRHVRETGTKGAYLVTVQENEVSQITHHACDVVRWIVIRTSAEEADSLNDILDHIRDAISRSVSNDVEGRLLACRLVIEGRTAIHSELISSEDQILADARAIALGLGNEVAWVERVVIDTKEVHTERASADHEDAIGELRKMLQEAKSDSDLLQKIEENVGELMRKLPHEAKRDADSPQLLAAIDSDYATLIDVVSPYVSARILSQED